MIVLLLFALLAGAATAVTPCVLPVLPALLSVRRITASIASRGMSMPKYARIIEREVVPQPLLSPWS